MEKWKKINEFSNYEVSNYGNVKHVVNGLLSKAISKKGYEVVSLWKNNKGHTKTIHRLVGFAFLKKQDYQNSINHLDSNRANNHFSNLEWCSHNENMTHGYKFGKVRPPRHDKKIIMLDMNDKELNIFNSIKDAAIFINGDPSHITKVLKGKLNHHKYKKFKYYEL